MAEELLDLYADYLISSFRATTATGLSSLVEGAVSHDQVTRFLASSARTSADLWCLVKPLVRTVQSPSGVLIVDDSIEDKPYTDENEIIAWHWDHSQQRAVKGINFLTALYHVQYQGADVALPVAFELVRKTQLVSDPKTGKPKRKSPTTKNESYRTMLRQCVRNGVEFSYVLNDLWYASAENMKFIRHQLGKDGKDSKARREIHFVMPLKDNRKVALSWADQQAGRYVRVDTLTLEENTVREVYLEAVDFPLLLLKQVFSSKSSKTETVARVCFIWWPVIPPSPMRPSRPSTKDGGRSKSITNP
jgi:DDE superfamily endonuclease